MKSHQAPQKEATEKSSFFERTSAALYPRALFRLSNLSAVSRESRMWGVKPKQDHEVENLTKQELGDLMEEDPNVKTTAEATGTIVRKAEDFGPDPEAIRAKEAKLALEAKKAKKKKRNRIFVVIGGILIVGAVVAGTSVAIIGAVEGEGNQVSPTVSPTLSPTSSPSLNPTNSPTKNPTSSPTPEPFRITDLADQEKLCEAIKESDEFNFADSATTVVYVSCQDDGGRSAFTCVGDGSLSNANDFCFNNDFTFCPCDPGQIIDATNLDGGFGGICADEIDDNELCSELEGDLKGLLGSSADGSDV